MLANRKAKDAAMASAMKREGVERTVAQCPMCHALIALRLLYGHICSCGRRVDKVRR